MGSTSVLHDPRVITGILWELVLVHGVVGLLFLSGLPLFGGGAAFVRAFLPRARLQLPSGGTRSHSGGAKAIRRDQLHAQALLSTRLWGMSLLTPGVAAGVSLLLGADNSVPCLLATVVAGVCGLAYHAHSQWNVMANGRAAGLTGGIRAALLALHLPLGASCAALVLACISSLPLAAPSSESHAAEKSEAGGTSAFSASQATPLVALSAMGFNCIELMGGLSPVLAHMRREGLRSFVPALPADHPAAHYHLFQSSAGAMAAGAAAAAGLAAAVVGGGGPVCVVALVTVTVFHAAFVAVVWTSTLAAGTSAADRKGATVFHVVFVAISASAVYTCWPWGAPLVG